MSVTRVSSKPAQEIPCSADTSTRKELPGWSPRKLREFAREIGACRILGNRMVLTQEDLDALFDALKPAPLYRRAVKPSTRPGFPTGDYAELVKLQEKQKIESEAARKRRKTAL